jgi:hypothetical protein
MGVALVTLSGGTGTGTWRDPDLTEASSAGAIVLEHTPQHCIADRRTGGTSSNWGALAVTPSQTGVTVTSSNGSDAGTVRVIGICNLNDLLAR